MRAWEVIKGLQEGKKMRQKFWYKDSYIKLRGSSEIDIVDHLGKSVSIRTIYDSDKWEVYAKRLVVKGKAHLTEYTSEYVRKILSEQESKEFTFDAAQDYIINHGCDIKNVEKPSVYIENTNLKYTFNRLPDLYKLVDWAGHEVSFLPGDPNDNNKVFEVYLDSK